MTASELRIEYETGLTGFHRVRAAMVEQLTAVVERSNLTLGVPIESRVKSWDSIEGKLKRQGRAPSSPAQLDDLIGVRVIFLFREDVEKFRGSLAAFSIISEEDTSTRLSDAEFGYQSHHYVVAMPEGWREVPTLAALVGQKVEIQVRTLAQHIWAAASHKLQYKSESSVPAPIRRTINRVSALLETVDLELSRVLEERQTYVRDASQTTDGPLDVTTVEAVLDDILPRKNKDSFEGYAELIEDLEQLGIHTREHLDGLLRQHFTAMMAAEAHEVATRDYADQDDDWAAGEPEEARLGRGVFFTHVGLTRQALSAAFGKDAVVEVMKRRHQS